MTTKAEAPKTISELEIITEPAMESVDSVSVIQSTDLDDLDILQDYIPDLDEDKYQVLVGLFDAQFYRDSYELQTVPDDELLAHFVTHGLNNNFSPSSLFDPYFAKKEISSAIDLEHKTLVDTTAISEIQQDNPNLETDSTFKIWLEHYSDTIIPYPYFDAGYYLECNPDVAESQMPPFLHFAIYGIYENRIPCEFFEDHIASAKSIDKNLEIDISAILKSIPYSKYRYFTDPEVQSSLQKIFMPELYTAHLSEDEISSESALYSHFVVHGALNNCRPSVAFNTNWYIKQLKNKYLELAAGEESKSEDQTELFDGSVGVNAPFWHWYFIGLTQNIIPTPLFDTDCYLNSNNDIRRSWKKHPFLHFIETGITEKFRKHSQYFNSGYYLSINKGTKHKCALLDYVLRGQFSTISPTQSLDTKLFETYEPFATSELEAAVIFFKEKQQRLSSGTLAEMVSKAAALEPMVLRPYGEVLFRYAPYFHPNVELMSTARTAEQDLPKKTYETVVLIPHCRMAGSARVAGDISNAIAGFSTPDDVLVLCTDKSDFERPDWFDENIDIFDMSSYISNTSQNIKTNTLLDLIRGLRPKRLLNVNSNLGWHLTNMYGKQLSEWMTVYVYLFCSDLDSRGNKSGYPVQWLLPTLNYCQKVLTDNNTLREELEARYNIPGAIDSSFLTLHSPIKDNVLDYSETLRNRGEQPGKRRIFWSGRFDRQKRLDILFEIAEKMPDIEFYVWGKPVLGDEAIKIDQAPDNILAMGTYESIDDLPLASCDLFLYTSAWDGLPTILLDIASRSIPIVASSVGGVPDLINHETGYPVDDYENSDSYVIEIQEALDNYSDAVSRGSKCREHTLSLCNNVKYLDSVNRLLENEI